MTLHRVSAEQSRHSHEGRVGIIDIGSNSMRLVIYDGLRRAALPIFNEKVLCALGSGLALTGKLNPEGVKLAEATMPRFLTMARLMNVVELDIVATAAVRDAKDGRKFVERLEGEFGVPIAIISGKREAKLGALGVLSSMHEPDGLSGDLGGGSMELCELKKGQIRKQVTLPLGSLRMIDIGKGSTAKSRKIIENSIKELDWLKKSKPKNFYAIGGSFRALATLHMERTHYPLKVLHQYCVPAESMLSLVKYIHSLSVDEIAKLPGVSAKRAAALIPASLIMEHVIRQAGVKQVVFSAHGIREGYLFEKLSPHIRKDDVLVSGCADYAAQFHSYSGYGRELFEWMHPLFGNENPELTRLRLSACLLSEIAWREHPEYRAEWAFHSVLQSSLTGLTHNERTILSLALFHRYQYRAKHNWPVLALLNDQERHYARLVGVAANLAYHLSGAQPGNLLKTKLEVKKDKVTVRLSQDIQDVLGEAVLKRIDGLGEVFKASAKRNK